MKKHHLILTIFATLSFTQNNNACPCGASSQDNRPFFEQYESSHNEPEETSEEDMDNSQEELS